MRVPIAAGFLLLSGAAALAQPAPPAPDQPQDKSCAFPEKNAPLGDRLSSSKGVICPPSTNDPGTVRPPESESKTPVIKPPADAK